MRFDVVGAAQQYRARTEALMQHYHHWTLANGARLHIIPTTHPHMAAFEVWAQVGSGDENASNAGVSHMLEHLMFRGTKSIPDGEFDNLVQALGAEANAWTWYDTTAYTTILQSSRLDQLIPIEADRFEHLLITEDVFQTERAVVLNERLLTVESNPSALAHEALEQTLFGEGAYATPVIGFQSHIEHFSREQVTQWYHDRYAPDVLDIFISGDVNVEHLRESIDKTFGAIPRPTRQRPTRPERAVHHTNIVQQLDFPVAEPLVLMAWGLPPSSDRKAMATWAILREILTFTRGGILRNALEYNQKLALSQYFYLQEHRLGHSAVWEATPRQHISSEALVDAFRDTIMQLAATGPSEDQLDAARIRMISHATGRSSPWDIVQRFGEALHNTDSVSNVLTDIDAWMQVDAADICALCEHLGAAKNSVLLYIQPEEEP